MPSVTKNATVTTQPIDDYEAWVANTLSPCSVTADDDDYAVSGSLGLDVQTRLLMCTGFAFAIPLNAYDITWTATCVCKSSVNGGVKLSEAGLIFDGVTFGTGANAAGSGILVTDSETDVLADAFSLGAYPVTPPPSPDIINSADFGIGLRFIGNLAAPDTATVSVEHVAMTLTYSVPAETRLPQCASQAQVAEGDITWKAWTLSGLLGDALKAYNDGNYTAPLTALQPNEYTTALRSHTFGFSIPLTATIYGVRIRVRRFASDGSLTDCVPTLQLVNASGTAFGEVKTHAAFVITDTQWYAPDDTTQDDMWTLDTTELTPAVVNSSGFGTLMRWRYTGATNQSKLKLDALEMTVFFGWPEDEEPPAGQDYRGGPHIQTRRGWYSCRYKR